MKRFNRRCNRALAAATPLLDAGRRRLLLLGLALAGLALGRRIPGLPSRPGSLEPGGRLSRREAAFYSRHDTTD